MTTAPQHLNFDVAGFSEHYLCFAPMAATRILIIPPLFDEMNRVRQIVIEAMRTLSSHNIGTALIDLPGCNESLAPLVDQSLSTWQEAVDSASKAYGATHIASIRGGALIDTLPDALPHWRLNPVKGASLLKTMIRTRIAGDREAGRTCTEADLMQTAQTQPIELAGNILGPNMVAELAKAIPDPLENLTVAMLGNEPGQIAGSPVWLRAEPIADPIMSGAIADALASWSQSPCVA